jgi:predicted nucleic acid-binding protein
VLAWVRSKDQNHARVLQFITDHLVASRDLYVSLLVLDETIWKMAQWEFTRSGGSLALLLKQQPALLATRLPQLRQVIEYLLGWAKLVEPGQAKAEQVLDTWIDRMKDLGQVHDALHVSLAIHGGAKSLATADKGFRRLPTGVPLQLIEV